MERKGKPISRERVLEVVDIMKRERVSPEDVEAVYLYMICHIIASEDLDVDDVVGGLKEGIEKGVKSIKEGGR